MSEPRTKAGRALRDTIVADRLGQDHAGLIPYGESLEQSILAIEAQAAAPSEAAFETRCFFRFLARDAEAAVRCVLRVGHVGEHSFEAAETPLATAPREASTSLEEALRQALHAKQFGECGHSGIGLPGCRTCDPRHREVTRMFQPAAANLAAHPAMLPFATAREDLVAARERAERLREALDVLRPRLDEVEGQVERLAAALREMLAILGRALAEVSPPTDSGRTP